jgi:MarR family transcriptional regulator, organic hydroperoxide resistance regulator
MNEMSMAERHGLLTDNSASEGLDLTSAARDPSSLRLPLSGSVAAQLRMVHRLFVRDLEHFLAPYDLRIGMWYFFRALWEQDGLSQRELSDLAGETATAAVQQLRILEHRGFIVRRPDATDKRKVRVFLTEEGHRLRFLLSYAAEVQSIALEGLTEGEIGFLRLVLTRMRESFARRAADQRRKNARTRHGPPDAPRGELQHSLQT